MIQNKLNKFYDMYYSKAYLHQYYEYKMDENDFINTLSISEQIIKRYNEI